MSASAILLVFIAAAQVRKTVITQRTARVPPVTTTAAPTPQPAFSAYASFWAFNKPCNTQKLWLRSSESLLQKEGLEIFDPANDNNISVAGYSAGKRLLVTVISIPAPNNRTSLVVNVFSDDGAINKTIGELFRQKFSGITMIDCN